LGEALAERLLAQDWLAEGKGGERDVAVCPLRACDHHGLDLRSLDEGAPVRCPAAESEGARFLLRLGFADRGEYLERRALRRVEDGSDRTHRYRMSLAHVPGPNDADSDASQARSPSSHFANCRARNLLIA